MISNTPSSSPASPFSELPPKTLETARLRLRAIQSGDGQLMFDLYASDPTTTRYMSFPCATTPADSESFAIDWYGATAIKLRSI